MSLYSEKIEALIDAALADGVLTEKEKQILFKKAQAEGIDLDEFEMVLDAKLVEAKKREKKQSEVISAPKSNKLGDIRKCPNCGAVIGSFQMTCPECGFEFVNIGLNKYVVNFSAGLKEAIANVHVSSSLFDMFDSNGMQEERKHNRAVSQAERRFVSNYPLPQTKEDCVEMLNYMIPKTTLSGSTGATLAWRRKMEAILKKLEVEGLGNNSIQQLVSSYREQTKMSGFGKFILWYKSLPVFVKTVFWIVLLYALLFGVVGYFLSANL